MAARDRIRPITSHGPETVDSPLRVAPIRAALAYWICSSSNLDSSGNLGWAKAYGGTGKDFGYCILETTDGGFIIAGERKIFGSGGSDILVIRTDHAGDLLRATTFGGSLGDYAQSFIQTSDAGLALAGVSYSYSSGGGDCILLKLSSAGALSWARTYGDARPDLASDLPWTSDAGFLIVGHPFSFSNPEHPDFAVIRTNSSGWPSWARFSVASAGLCPEHCWNR